MKQYQHILWAMVLLLFSCTPQESPNDNNNNNENGGDNTGSINVNVTTGTATDIEQESAVLNGTCSISNAKSANGVACFYYSTTNADSNSIKASGKKVSAGDISNKGSSFNATASGLIPSTTYYYVAAVSIDGQDYLGDVKSLSTKEKSKDLTSTGSANNITEISATLSGYANPTPDMGAVTMGILLSLSQNPSLDNSTELTSKELDGNNMYSVRADGLQSNTTYYYKSFLQYGGVYRFGEVKSFKTLDFSAVVTTLATTGVGMFNATLNGSLRVESTVSLSKNVWFLYGDGNLETLKSSGKKITINTIDGSGSFSFSISDLPYAHSYSVVACAKVHDKEIYGDVLSFSTNDISVEITTGQATGVDKYTATISGSLIVNNEENLSKEAWFVYGTDSSLNDLKNNGTKVSVTIGANGSFQTNLSNIKSNTTYYFTAAAKVHDKEFFGDVLSFTTVGYTYVAGEPVDMGFGVKWCSHNLGATKPEEIGAYFAWGELEPKQTYTWETYKFCNGTKESLTKYNSAGNLGVVDKKKVLDLEDDAAHVLLGGSWKIPTSDDWYILYLNCSMETYTKNGIKYIKFTSDVNHNSIIVPYAGFIYGTQVTSDTYYPDYWTNELADYPASALFYMGLDSFSRCEGLQIRPVCN